MSQLKRTNENYRGFRLYVFRNAVSGRVEVWYRNIKLADNKTKKESMNNAKERIDYQLFRTRF